MQEIFLDGDSHEITRWCPGTGKVWNESTDESLEQRIFAFCNGLWELFPKPETTEAEFCSRLSEIQDGEDSLDKTLAVEAGELYERTGYMISPYECWWAYCHANLSVMYVSGGGLPKHKEIEDHVANEMGYKQDLRKKNAIAEVWQYLVKRLVGSQVGAVSLSMLGRALQGDPGAIGQWIKAFKPDMGITRSEKTLEVRGQRGMLDVSNMSEGELMSEIERARKSVGEKSLNPLRMADEDE